MTCDYLAELGLLELLIAGFPEGLEGFHCRCTIVPCAAKETSFCRTTGRPDLLVSAFVKSLGSNFQAKSSINYTGFVCGFGFECLPVAVYPVTDDH